MKNKFLVQITNQIKGVAIIKNLRYYHQNFLGGTFMNDIAKRLKAYIETHPLDLGDGDCETVLDQLYQAYAESHESDPPEISNGFKELEEFLCVLPLEDNNEVFNLCCRLCTAYERKAFLVGLQYGAHLILELRGE